MVSALLTLPQELLIKIISRVPDQVSLYKLLQCSRLLYDLALPLLYRQVEFSSTSPDDKAFNYRKLPQRHLQIHLSSFAPLPSSLLCQKVQRARV